MTARNTSNMDKKKFLLDIDPGVDDAQALVMALSKSEEVDIVGITCVHGNVPLQQVLRNCFRILELCNRLDVPVYAGCDSPLIPTITVHESVHGSDGLGDVPDIQPKERKELSLLQAEHASLAICRLAKQYEGELTLIALAPLTNVAVALKLDPTLGENLKETIIMGGNMRGMGNVSPAAEFNFWKDPEAAQMCVSTIPNMTIVTWECCTDVGLSWEWYDRVASLDTPKAKFLASVNINMTTVRRKKFDNYHACDPTAVAIGLDPSVIASSKKCFCEVELAGSATRGQMVVDWQGRTGRSPNVTVVTKTCPQKIMDLFENMLKQ